MSTVPTNPPANPVPGAVYVDLATNTAYVWTGTGWVPSGGSTGYNSGITTGAAILPGYFAKPTPESYVPQVGSEPLNPSEGQIWVDDTVTPSPAYVWHDTGWVKLTDGTFTDTTVSTMPPGNPDIGDTYFETSTNRFYVWADNSWKWINDTTVTGDSHSIYFASADILTSPPTRNDGVTPPQNGDLWVNPTLNTVYYQSGGTWYPITSAGSGSVALANLNTAGTVYGLTEDSTNNNHTFLGWNAGNVTAQADGSYDTFIGQGAGKDATEATNCVFLGYWAGYNTTTGEDNVGIGNYTCAVDSGNNNVAVGYAVLGAALGSSNNTGLGYNSLSSNVGSNNTAVGFQSLINSVGSGNTVIGSYNANNIAFDNHVVLAKTGTVSNRVLSFNEDNAMGVATWNSASANSSTVRDAVDYGIAGQVLTSQGPTAPPQWITTTGVKSATGLNSSSLIPTDFIGKEVFAIVKPGQTNIVLRDSSYYTVADNISFIKFTTQHTSTITITTQGGADLFNGAGTSYTWTPNAVGEILTIYYLSSYHTATFGNYGWIVEKSAT